MRYMSTIADYILVSIPYTVCEGKRGDSLQFDNSAVGQAIRRLRLERGLSQDVLSGLAGIARTHLTMIENGDKQPNFETVWKIALALDMQPSALVAAIETEISGIKP